MPDASSTPDADGAMAATCPDGSTLDLDGDGILWCDDPVESITIPAPMNRYVAGAIHRDAVAVLIAEGCFVSDPCPHTLFAASSHGKLVVRSDSTQPADAWAKRDALAGPFISRYGHIYVGRRASQFVGDTVTIDLATNTTVARGSTMLSGSLRDATNQPVLATLAIYTPTTLVEPQSDGSLTTIATSDRWFRPIAGFDPFLPMSPTMFVAEDGVGYVRTFRPGDTALSELSPPASAILDLRSVVTPAGIATCIRTAATGVMLYEQTSAITSTPLPFGSCAQVQTRIVGSHTLYEGWGPDMNGDGVSGRSVYERIGNTFEPIVVDKTAPLRVVGDDVIMIVEQVSDAPQPVWIYRTGSAPQLVVSDLEHVDVSVAGDVAHVVGVRRTLGLTGPLLLIRLKTGAPNQTLELHPDASVYGKYPVVTSKEGAAISGSGNRAWIVPSSSFAVVESTAFVQGGGVRGSHTVVTTRTGAFAYREVGGTPELVAIKPVISAGNEVTYTEVDSPVLPATEWFKTEETFNGPCLIGRVKDSAQGPTLESVSCSAMKQYRVVGTSADGSLFVGDSYGYGSHRELFKLSPAGPKVIATGIVATTPLFDYSRGTRVIGWTTAGNSVCLDEQPRRCWSLPPYASPVDTVLESDGLKHHVAQLLVSESPSGGTLITIVRSIGPGTPSI